MHSLSDKNDRQVHSSAGAQGKNGIALSPPAVQFRKEKQEGDMEQLTDNSASLPPVFRLPVQAKTHTPTNDTIDFRSAIHSQTVQRVIVGAQSKNHYQEVRRNNNANTNVDTQPRNNKTLLPITETDYNDPGTQGRLTEETGTTTFTIDTAGGENAADWQLNLDVLQWDTPTQFSALQNFNLPVSCIESTEHVMHYTQRGGGIGNYGNASRAEAKDVHLHFQGAMSGVNEDFASASNDDLTAANYGGHQDFDFASEPLALNEGLLVIDPLNPDTSMHAVVVVAIHTSGAFIVLERNAGETTGDNIYVDNSWLLNLYNSPGDFRDSVNVTSLVGKLKV